MTRAKARRLAHNNREFILLSRLESGDCLYCPRHDGENMRGEHSKYGKKAAMKTYYATGKHRKTPKVYGTCYTYKDAGVYHLGKWLYREGNYDKIDM